MALFDIKSKYSYGITISDSSGNSYPIAAWGIQNNAELDTSGEIYLTIDDDAELPMPPVKMDGTIISNDFSTVNSGSSSSDPKFKCSGNDLASYFRSEIGAPDDATKNITVGDDEPPLEK